MRWRKGDDQRGQIEDRRAQGGGPARGGLGGFGGLGGAKGGIGGLGVVGIIVAVEVVLLGRGGGGGFGLDMGQRNALPTQSAQQGTLPADLTSEDNLRDFVAFVVNDVQNSWSEAFERAGTSYPTTRLVLFRGGVNTGCGAASSAMGPFYCDDRIQVAGGGRGDPESFTHGTSQQRTDWFMRGFENGDAAACDTFAGDI